MSDLPQGIMFMIGVGDVAYLPDLAHADALYSLIMNGHDPISVPYYFQGRSYAKFYIKKLKDMSDPPHYEFVCKHCSAGLCLTCVAEGQSFCACEENNEW